MFCSCAAHTPVLWITCIGNDGAACPTSCMNRRWQAGAVRSRAAQRKATSDWMELEKQRGISITSTVLSFEYSGNHINLLDTPGHQVCSCAEAIDRCVYLQKRALHCSAHILCGGNEFPQFCGAEISRLYQILFSRRDTPFVVLGNEQFYSHSTLNIPCTDTVQIPEILQDVTVSAPVSTRV